MRYRPAPPRSVASRITAILSTFLTGESHSITEIAHMTGLPVSTTHRISADLAAWQLLQRAADGRYGVGSILQLLGGVAVAAPELKEWAPGVVLDLCAATGMRARFAVLDEGRIVYIEKRPGPEPITSFSAGATLPAHASAAGKAILAFSSPATVRCVAQNLVTFTPLTVNTPDRLRRALGIVRLARTAVARAELAPGQSDVAAPVFGCGGVAVAALELEVHNLAAELELARAALAVAARGLSRQLTVDPVDHPGRRQLRLAPVLGGTAAGA
jgi:DNA-binding IclR family transcriptional regulator